MSGGYFLQTGFVPHFLRKLKLLVYSTALLLGYFCPASLSKLVQMRKSLLRLITNTLLHFNSSQCSAELIHIKRDKDTVERTLIIITDPFPFQGIQNHVTVHEVSFHKSWLPLSSLLIITIGSDNTSLNFISYDIPFQDIPRNAITEILVWASGTDIIQNQNNLGWKRKSQGTLE